MIKRTKKALAAVLMLALLSGLLSACGGGGALDVKVENLLGYDLTELYISAADADSWGDSLGVLADGKTMTLQLEHASPGAYDVMASDTDGDYYYFYDLPLSNRATLSLVSTATGWQAQITDKKGETVSVEGDLEFAAEDAEISPPSAEDPLKRSIPMPGYENVIIPYPATMQVITEDADSLHLQLDALNEPDVHECITFALIQLGGSYEARLNAGSDSAKTALAEIAPKVCDVLFTGKLIKSLGSNFVDAGNYYSYSYYTWMAGEIFDEAAETPVRGALDVRYYGPTGYVLAIFTLADESAIKRYYDIANKIVADVTLNPGWSTSQIVANNDPQYGSDPGDNGIYYDDEWYEPNDWDPWSDPGDTGYYEDEYYYDDSYYYDDGWYESNDYDPWSDPGDYGYDY